jgi:hypothetical protein
MSIRLMTYSVFSSPFLMSLIQRSTLWLTATTPSSAPFSFMRSAGKLIRKISTRYKENVTISLIILRPLLWYISTSKETFPTCTDWCESQSSTQPSKKIQWTWCSWWIWMTWSNIKSLKKFSISCMTVSIPSMRLLCISPPFGMSFSQCLHSHRKVSLRNL